MGSTGVDLSLLLLVGDGDGPMLAAVTESVNVTLSGNPTERQTILLVHGHTSR